MFYLVGISGENGVGKTTLAQQIVGFSDFLGTEAIHESFATPIRYAARALGFSTQYGKKDTDKITLDAKHVYHTVYSVLISDYCFLDTADAYTCALKTLYALGGHDFLSGGSSVLPECTCRDFMIAFGEACKKHNKNIWLEALIDRIIATGKHNCLVILDDVRFGNEAKMCDKVINLIDCSEGVPVIFEKDLADRFDIELDVNDPRLLEKVLKFLEYKLV